MQWLDHWETDEGAWHSLEETVLQAIAHPQVVTSVGYIVCENDDVYVLSAAIDAEGKYCGRPFILLKSNVVGDLRHLK